jgi:transcriptional repressor NrdR
MHCPFCRHTDTRVIDSRTADDGGAIRRRRQCSQCQKRFSTVEQMQLAVLKKSGATEPFDRSKAIAGVAKACKGRPVGDDDLARLGQQVEDALRASGWAEVPAHEVGLAILGPLRELDEVAYLRFASVYRSFESADDFETEIAILRAERSAAVTRSVAAPTTSEFARTDAGRPDAARTAPARTAPARTGPARTGAARTEAGKTDAHEAETTRAGARGPSYPRRT